MLIEKMTKRIRNDTSLAESPPRLSGPIILHIHSQLLSLSCKWVFSLDPTYRGEIIITLLQLKPCAVRTTLWTLSPCSCTFCTLRLPVMASVLYRSKWDVKHWTKAQPYYTATFIHWLSSVLAVWVTSERDGLRSNGERKQMSDLRLE